MEKGKNRRFDSLPAMFLLLMLLLSDGYPASAFTPPDPALLATAYQGGERFRYSVTWLGLTAGELDMAIGRQTEDEDRFLITVVARTAGLLGVLYPVEDRFEVLVAGEKRLPVRYDQEQQEGTRRNRRRTTFDQERFVITYNKNEDPPLVYNLSGPVHNEFSAFFYLRVLPLVPEQNPTVPTFADKKRHEVEVFWEKKETIPSLIGEKTVILVRPHLKFKGLYEKVGDPRIWLTDDQYRIPLLISAKIIIGSLIGRLVEYQGPLGLYREAAP